MKLCARSRDMNWITISKFKTKKNNFLRKEEREWKRLRKEEEEKGNKREK